MDEKSKNSKILLITLIVLIVLLAIGSIITFLVIYNRGNNEKANTNNNVSTTNAPILNETGDVSTINLVSLKEVNVELSEDTITTQGNIKKDYGKSSDSEMELNITALDMKINTTNVYKAPTISDGIILFYDDRGSTGIEKFNMSGISEWTTDTKNFRFYNFMEVSDGYFVLGHTGETRFITKLDKKGNIKNVEYILFDEKELSNIAFIESQDDHKNGTLEIIGMSDDGINYILKYDKDCKLEQANKIELADVACEKIIKKNNIYYGYGEDSTRDNNIIDRAIIFAFSNDGNVIFNKDYRRDSTFQEYVQFNSFIKDIAVNSNYIFICVANPNDVYALDLDGNLKIKFGYNTNKILNKGYYSNVQQIFASDESIFIYDTTPGTNRIHIDKVSSDFKYAYRMKIPNSKLIPNSAAFKGLETTKLSERAFWEALLYDDTSLAIFQYTFK